MRKSLERIFNHYGHNKQLEKFSCEVAELSLAIHRFKENCSSTNLNAMTDEISDVMNMMDQFIMFHGIAHDIELIRATKVQRTLKQIIAEKQVEYEKIDEVF